ncbi:hypothetical protein C8J56DRAFT_950620 [Mycena floridula]|nr:hypothetical protein C8J56DRAFT_950620 [Mycena floridula]
MKFSSIFATSTLFLASLGGSVATPSPPLTSRADQAQALGISLTKSNYYGAPTPPWKGGKPGWYNGNHPEKLPFPLPCLTDKLICLILSLLPFDCLKCPKPNPPKTGWTQVFYNLTAAVQADDFQTFGLVETVDDCKAMCLSVSGCTFFNTYHDVNGKDGSPLLTCSLFSSCHTAADADNAGGQSQPDGSIDFITDSEGWCFKK